MTEHTSHEHYSIVSHLFSVVTIIDAFNPTSRYFDDILNNNNVYFDNMVSQISLQSSNLIKLIPRIPRPRF